MKPSARIDSAAVIGRAGERRRLDDFVAQVPTAGRSLVLVGEAGIGKSTLWTYGLRRARAAGFRVLLTRPAEDDWSTPGQGLRDFFLEERPGVLSSLLGDGCDPAERAHTFLTLLRELAAERPLLLGIDDVPWLDDLSLHLVRFAMRRLTEAPVAVLATARTWTPAQPLVPLRRHTLVGDEVAVAAPGVAELREILAQDGIRLSRPELERLYRSSGGNPLFALELGRATGDRAALATSALRVIAEQVGQLAPHAREVLDLVCLAEPISVTQLASGLVLSPGPAADSAHRSASGDSGTVGDAEGRARQVLGLLSGPLTSLVEMNEHFVVRCAHPLIASAARTAMDPVVRQALHGRLADLAVDPVRRARHLVRSVTVADSAIAATVEAAAALAVRQGSAATGAELAAHAVRLTPPQEREDSVRRGIAEVTYRAAAGQVPQAVVLADQLLARTERGPQYARVVMQRVMLDFSHAEGYLRRALAGTVRGEPLRGVLLDLLGWQLGLFKGRLEESVACCEEALEIAVASRDEAQQSRAAATLATVSLLAGRPRRSLMNLVREQGTETTTAPGPGRGSGRRSDSGTSSALLRVRPEVFQARQAIWEGDLPRARAGFERSYRMAVELGSEFQRPYRLRDLALLELAEGNVEAGHRLALDGLEAAYDASHDQAVVWLAYPIGLVAALRGDEVEADWAADIMREWAVRIDEPLRTLTSLHVRGVLAASRLDWVGAGQHLTRAVRLCNSLGYAHPGFIAVLPAAIETATVAGDAATCADLVGQLHEQARAVAAPWVDAQATHARGQLHLVSGELDQAVAELGRGAAALASLGYRLDAHRARYFCALAQLRRGHRAQARTELATCRAYFEEQRLVGWTALVSESLRRLQDVDSVVTATELLIAGKVKSGLRNREIAVELFVSESTVEAHLTRIYRKLGVRGRSELAALDLAEPRSSP